MNDWKEVNFRNVIKNYIGGGWGSDTPTSELVPVKVIRGTDFAGYKINDFDKIPSRYEKENKVKSRNLLDGDIVIEVAGGSPTSGQYTGRSILIDDRLDFESHNYIPASFCKKVSLDKEKVIPKFIYYWLTKIYQTGEIGIYELQSTGISNFNFEFFIDNEPLLLPPLHEQRAIAEVLGALDDKIEHNRRTNQTLEAMARALFRDWFVDFGPTRAKAEGREAYLAPDLWARFPEGFNEDGLPEGWGVEPLYEFADVVYGAPFASKLFNTEAKGKPLIRIRDLKTYEPSIFTEEVHPKGTLIKPGDLVIGMDGEFRIHLWFGPDSWLNQRVCQLVPKPNISKGYVLEAIKPKLDYFERGKVGTTVIHLGKSDFDTINLIKPSDELMANFELLTDDWLKALVSNSLENRQLSALRDYLLPKLISGEVRVRDAEKIVGESI